MPYEAPENKNEKAVSALIHFAPGTDLERVKRWVAALDAAGHVEGATVEEYNPHFGSPVWYVP